MASKYSSFKIFYDGVALLSTVANKQTMALGFILSIMNEDNLVVLSAYYKKQMIKEIGADTKHPINLADQYINKLKTAGLLCPAGGDGAYMVNPKLASKFNDFKFIRDADEIKYMRLEMLANNKNKVSIRMSTTNKL